MANFRKKFLKEDINIFYDETQGIDRTGSYFAHGLEMYIYGRKQISF